MSPIEIAKNYVRAVQTGDGAGLVSLLANDILWHQPGQNLFSGTHRGRAAVVDMIGEMMNVSAGTFAKVWTGSIGISARCVNFRDSGLAGIHDQKSNSNAAISLVFRT